VQSRPRFSRLWPYFLVPLLLAVPAPKAWCQPVELMARIPLVPAPRVLTYRGEKIPFPDAISVLGLDGADPVELRTVETMQAILRLLPEVKSDFGGRNPYTIRFEHSARVTDREGYLLSSGKDGIVVTYGTEAGQYYGAQTVYQLLGYAYHGAAFLVWDNWSAEARRCLPVLTIEDRPAYAVRAVMADLGRAPYSVALLKREIRIMGQLKLNTLHLRLYDDELCGFRFAHLPLGHENPRALTAADLREIVRYARSYHVAVIPELESWAHVQSIVFHYPQLRGAAGMWGGSSFGIGEPTYALLEKMYDEIVPCLEDSAAVHVGLDEAVWSVLPGEESAGHSPTTLVERIHQILMQVAARHHKKITMHLWADSGGRPLPEGLERQVVVEPWAYFENNAPDIVRKLAQWGGAGKAAVMMGAGVNWSRAHGDYEATRIWCNEGLKYPNVLGVTLCLWGTNDLAGRLMTLYGGAGLAWSPVATKREPNDITGEFLRNRLDFEMQHWQVLFPDADPRAIDADRGREVRAGRDPWSPLPAVEIPVAPTVEFVPPQTQAERRAGQAEVRSP